MHVNNWKEQVPCLPTPKCPITSFSLPFTTLLVFEMSRQGEAWSRVRLKKNHKKKIKNPLNLRLFSPGATVPPALSQAAPSMTYCIHSKCYRNRMRCCLYCILTETCSSVRGQWCAKLFTVSSHIYLACLFTCGLYCWGHPGLHCINAPEGRGISTLVVAVKPLICILRLPLLGKSSLNCVLEHGIWIISDLSLLTSWPASMAVSQFKGSILRRTPTSNATPSKSAKVGLSVVKWDGLAYVLVF